MEHSGPVITAAALIMIGVFGSFVLNGDPTVKQFGVGLAGRWPSRPPWCSCWLPAVLTLMGRWTGGCPAGWREAIPEVDIEGEGLVARRAAEGTFPGAPAPAPKGPAGS